MIKKLLIAGFMCLIGVSSVFAGGNSESAAADGIDGTIDIVATTGMIGDIVSNVAGDRGSVFVLMDDEVDPHLFRPTRSDVARMQQADIIFYNGLNLEGQMADTLVQLARSRPVFAVTELVDNTAVLEDEEDDAYFDPHLWMDVSLWMRAVEQVVTAMNEFDPAGADDYRSNADEYLSELEELDAYAQEVIASIPAERRFLVTAHDAFQYLGQAYGIEVIGVQGISTESEAGLEDINGLVDFIVQNQITAVFAETTVADRALTAVLEGAADQGHEVTIGGELFSDAMGPAGTYEGTYIGMIDHNATTIAEALGGSAPAGGFRGRLSQ